VTSSTKYIGMDVHKESISIAVGNASVGSGFECLQNLSLIRCALAITESSKRQNAVRIRKDVRA